MGVVTTFLIVVKNYLTKINMRKAGTLILSHSSREREFFMVEKTLVAADHIMS